MPTKKWVIGEVEYEVVNATDMAFESGDKVLGEVMGFTEKLAQKVDDERRSGVNNAEAAVRLDGDNFFTGGGSPRDCGCITARKDGKVVGVLSFEWGDETGHLDRGVVAREERKRTIENGKPISDDLMRLALAELVTEHNCESISAEPASDRGRKYTEANGFKLEGDEKAGRYGKGFYYLDNKIVDKMKKFLAKKTDGQELTPDVVLELRNEFDNYLSEVMSERQGELGRKNL